MANEQIIQNGLIVVGDTSTGNLIVNTINGLTPVVPLVDGQGTTAHDGSIDLGGIYTAPVLITNTNNKDFTISAATSSGASNSVKLYLDAGNKIDMIWEDAAGDYEVAFNLSSGSVTLQSDNYITSTATFLNVEETRVIINLDNAGYADSMNLQMTQDGSTVFKNEIGSSGINYFTDYSANFTSRTLVDKGWVISYVQDVSDAVGAIIAEAPAIGEVAIFGGDSSIYGDPVLTYISNSLNTQDASIKGDLTSLTSVSTTFNGVALSPTLFSNIDTSLATLDGLISTNATNIGTNDTDINQLDASIVRIDGLLVSVGTDNYIPISNSGGTDFDYDAGFTYDGTRLEAESTGTDSVAIGTAASAAAEGGISIGDTASATNIGGIAMGWDAEAAGDYGISIGVNAGSSTSSNAESISIGYENNSDLSMATTGTGSISLGSYSDTKGDYSVAAGYTAIVSGDYGIAIGDNTNVSSQGGMAFGRYSSSGGGTAIMMGYHTSTQTNAHANSFELAWGGVTAFKAGTTYGTQVTCNIDPGSNLTDASRGSLAWDITDGELQVKGADGSWSGLGDVNGPVSSTDLAIPKFTGTGGKTLVNTGVTINASNDIITGGDITVTDASVKGNLTSLTSVSTTFNGVALETGGTATTYLSAGGTYTTPTGGDVSKTGTPGNNQLAVWTDSTTIEGGSEMTFNGTTFKIAATNATRITADASLGTSSAGLVAQHTDGAALTVTAYGDTSGLSSIGSSLAGNGELLSLGELFLTTLNSNSMRFGTANTLSAVIDTAQNWNFQSNNLTTTGNINVQDASIKGALTSLTSVSTTFNGVALETGGTATTYLSAGGTYTTPAGGVTASPTPANNQLAVWTNGTTIEGNNNLMFDGTTLSTTVDASINGALHVQGAVNLSTSGAPTINFEDTGAGSDEKVWQMWNANKTWTLQTKTDAGGGGSNAIQITRTGTNVDTVILDASTTIAGDASIIGDVAALTFNGAPLGAGGDVSKTGTPANDQLAVFTNSTTIEGTSDLIYDGTTLAIEADVSINGHISFDVGLTDKNTDYTVLASDNGKILQLLDTAVANRTFTMPVSTLVTSGWSCQIVNVSSSYTLTIAEPTDASVHSKSGTRPDPILASQYGGCTIYFDGTDYVAIGDLT
jgi:hypothetical protein